MIAWTDLDCMDRPFYGCAVFDWLCVSGSFRNDDGDGKENVKKAVGLLSKTTTLHVHHAFWYISLPSFHNYDVKMPHFTFYRGVKQGTTNFAFSF